MTTDIKTAIDSAVENVAIQAKLTGHGRRSFEGMARDAIGRVQASIVESESARADQALEADRTRINEIMSSSEAKGREKAALKLATGSSMTPAQAVDMLAGFPKHSGDPLAKYMGASGTPGINSDIGDLDDLSESEEAEAAANFIANAGR